MNPFNKNNLVLDIDPLDYVTIQYKKNGETTGNLKIVSFNILISADGARWDSPLVATNQGKLVLLGATKVDMSNSMQGRSTLAYGCVTRRDEWNEYPMLWKMIQYQYAKEAIEA